jgi:uncharacterized membrane protein
LAEHALFGAIAMVVAAFQFSNRLRARYLRMHRALGNVYVTSVFISAPSAVLIAIKIPKSFSLVAANCMQSFGWFVTTAVALYCIRSGNVALHRRWMIRSYLFAMVSPLPVLSTSSRLTRLETPCSANFVLIEGQEEQHPEGSYYIEWYDGNKRLRRSVGKNALAAEAIRHQHEQVLTAKADGLKAGLKFAEESNRPSLRSRNDYS